MESVIFLHSIEIREEKESVVIITNAMDWGRKWKLIRIILFIFSLYSLPFSFDFSSDYSLPFLSSSPLFSLQSFCNRQCPLILPSSVATLLLWIIRTIKKWQFWRVENEWENEWNDEKTIWFWLKRGIHSYKMSIDRPVEWVIFPPLSINNLLLYSKRQFYSALSTTVTIGVVRWEILYHPSSSSSSFSQCWSLHVSCPWNIRYSIGWTIRRMVKNEWRRSQSTTN